MNINKETLIKHCSFGIRQIYCPMGDDAPSTDEIAKVTSALLRSVGIRKDAIELTRRKLKSGGYRYFLIIDGIWVVDPTYDGGCGDGVWENEHPMMEEFRGRGREPLMEREEVSEDNPLTVAAVIKSITFIPKVPTSKHRDDPQMFFFRLKDLRQQLKKFGITVSYTSISELIDSSMADDFDAHVISGVKGYCIKSGVTLGEWISNSRMVSDLIETIHDKHVTSKKATG